MRRVIIIDERTELEVWVDSLETRFRAFPPLHPRARRPRMICLIGLVLHVLVWVGGMCYLEEIRASKLRDVLGGHENTLRVIGEIVSRESR